MKRGGVCPTKDSVRGHLSGRGRLSGHGVRLEETVNYSLGVQPYGINSMGVKPFNPIGAPCDYGRSRRTLETAWLTVNAPWFASTCRRPRRRLLLTGAATVHVPPNNISNHRRSQDFCCGGTLFSPQILTTISTRQ